LTRFFRLIHNEYIKVFHKASTYIMLGLVVLAALGLNLFALLMQNSMINSRQSYWNYSEEYYDDQINYLKDAKPEGYELQIEQYTFMKEQSIEPYGQNDWRSDAAHRMFEKKMQIDHLKEVEGGEQEIKRINTYFDESKTAILNKDWKAYCRADIKWIDTDPTLTKEQKEQNKWNSQYRLDHDVAIDGQNWKSRLLEETAYLKLEVEEARQTQQSGQAVKELSKKEDQLLINLYRLDNDVTVDVGVSGLTTDWNYNFWSVFSSSTSLIQVVSLLIIVIAGSCVASEFSSGTIKFLLINPVKRWKILTSKYVMVLSFSFLMLALFYVVNILFTLLFFGGEYLGAPYLSVSGGLVHAQSGFLHMAWMYLLGSVNMIVMSTLAFAISSLVRSSALAIGVSLFAMLAGSGGVLFMKNILQIDWVRYTIFANTDLNSIVTGSTPFASQTVGFALLVIAAHMVVFLLTAWDGFVRREV
jgi:ABC-2 type transport system permease protein